MQIMNTEKVKIWIVTANQTQERLCKESLAGEELSFFPSWEAIIAELVVTTESAHPHMCLLYDFDSMQTKLWLPLLRDQLAAYSEVILFGPASDLKSMQQYFQESQIVDYLGLPLNSARLMARLERGKLRSA